MDPLGPANAGGRSTMLHGARLRTHEFRMYTRDSVAICSMQTLVNEGSGSTCRTAGAEAPTPMP